MTLARKCDSCGVFIKEEYYYDVTISKKRVEESPEQDSKNTYGEFCGACIINGKAINSLIEEEE